MIDFNYFFAQAAICMLHWRVFVILKVANDERFAREAFDCYSAPARLRAIVQLVMNENLEIG